MRVNLKKELGLALEDVKGSDWFKSLDKETQAIALEQQKDYYTPPRQSSHTLLNIFVSTYCQTEWDEYRVKHLPWAGNGNEGGDIAWHKQQFAAPYILKWQEEINSIA